MDIQLKQLYDNCTYKDTFYIVGISELERWKAPYEINMRI